MSQFVGGRKDPPWSQLAVAQGASPAVSLAPPGILAGAGAGVYGQLGTATAAATSAAAFQLQQQQSQQQVLQQQQAAALQQVNQQLSMAQAGLGRSSAPNSGQQVTISYSAARPAQPNIVAAAGLAAGSNQSPQLTVSYPAPRSAQTNQPKQRVFTGTVTKLHDTFGFVDEDVFFQVTACVKGVMPKVGERVLVEAAYNPNMPFKWNATRVQVLPNQGQPLLKGPPGLGASVLSQQQGLNPGLSQGIPSLMGQQLVHNPINQGTRSTGGQGLLQAPSRGPSLGQAPRRRDGPASYQTRDRRDERDRERERDREMRERQAQERDRERERERTERHRRERSPVRRRSRERSPRRSPRRTKRLVPRYAVSIAKTSLSIPQVDVIELRKRYTNMYIPSDFFLSNFKWLQAFPMHRPLQIGNPCTFHIMNKEVEPLIKRENTPEPADASYVYSAKVMLMASVSLQDLFKSCCGLGEDSSDARDNFKHPTRLIQFLVGQKGKNEDMAIGGPWSPSLDGPDPSNDSSVLIRTAIRTTRTLTGIDLSSCTHWYRFLEIRYHRPEETHKGRVLPARVETVVIFVPDVWHLLPTRVEWESTVAAYKKELADKVASVGEVKKEAASAEELQAEDTEGEGNTDMIPTNFKLLDPKNMKVNELRHELECRTLNSKGLKSQLIARLTKTLKAEAENEESVAEAEKEAQEEAAAVAAEAEEEAEEDEEKTKELWDSDSEVSSSSTADEEKKRQEEREKRELERRYTLPDHPCIVVHPSPTAKAGKFDCALTSLSVLLDYRIEDNKEHSFEVSLFAELFNEMLQRDFAFNIYKALLKAPEKPKDEKKEKDKDKKDKDKDKDKSDEPKSKKRKTDDKGNAKDSDKDHKDEEKYDDDDRDGNDDDDDGDGKSEDDGEGGEEPPQNTTTDDKKKDDKKKDERKHRSPSTESRRVKQETVDPQLLLSCIYFDQNHCGYLLERDLEEIIHSIGVGLSRSQVRKLIQKVIARDSWSYRRFTDKPKDRKDSDSAQAAIKVEVNGGSNDEELAKGNQSLIGDTSVAIKKEKNEPPASQGLVTYQGAVLDVANLLQRVEKGDQDRQTSEKRIQELEQLVENLKSNVSSSEDTARGMSADLSDLRKKLSSSEKSCKSAVGRANKLKDVIGTSQKALDEVMLKFNEVLEEDDK